MLNILGLEKHKILYDALTDFDNMMERNESLTDLQIKDLVMRLRYALEHILQQYAKVREIPWTTPFEVINTLRRDRVITWEEANALHAARRIANAEGAHLNEEKSPMELIVEAFQGLVDFVPKFLSDIPEPSTLPLLKAVGQVDAVEAAKDEPVEQREHFPLVKVKCGSIPLLKVDASHKIFDAIPGFGGITRSRRKTLLAEKSDIPPYNLNLVEWLYRNPDEEHRYIYTIPQGTFVRRGLLAEDYLKRVNTLIQQFNQKGTIGEPVYIPGLVQEYFGFSQVYFEGEKLTYVPVEPAVILRDYALFCETVELPDCVKRVDHNDLLKQVNEFTLNPQVKGSAFSRVKHLILPASKWKDRVFLRYFTNLETVKIKGLGEIDPTPDTGEPNVYPSTIRIPKTDRERDSYVASLRFNPKFTAFMETVEFDRKVVTVGKFGTDTVYVPAWVFEGQKRFGIHIDVVYIAGCGVKNVSAEPIRKVPASASNGYRGFSNAEEKEQLIRSLMEDPDFIDFVQSQTIVRKEIWVRNGEKIAEPYVQWISSGVHYMNVHKDAIYEAACRLKGLDPTPIMVEKPVPKTVMQKPVCSASAKKPIKSFIVESNGFRTFDCPEGKEALVQALMADPQFVAFAKVNRARPKRKLFESPYPWYQQGAQKFRAHIDAVYEAGLRITGYSKAPQQPATQQPPKTATKPAAPSTPKPAAPSAPKPAQPSKPKPQPAPQPFFIMEPFLREPDGFLTFDNPGGKETLINYLVRKPEFVEFVNSNPIKAKNALGDDPDPWYKRASKEFQAHEDAVYEAGLRIKGLPEADLDPVHILGRDVPREELTEAYKRIYQET